MNIMIMLNLHYYLLEFRFVNVSEVKMIYLKYAQASGNHNQ